MRREGRIGGKRTSHSKKTGKCKVVGCEACHESLPLNKSRGKGKGRVKRLASDIPSTHLMSDWRVSRPAFLTARLGRVTKWDGDADWAGDEDDAAAHDGRGGEPEGWALSISLLLDAALEHVRASVAARKAEDTDDDDEDDDADVPDFEAFKNEFEVFKSEIDAARSPSSVTASMDSWSGIELSDADESSLGDWEDDWSLVDDETIA